MLRRPEAPEHENFWVLHRQKFPWKAIWVSHRKLNVIQKLKKKFFFRFFIYIPAPSTRLGQAWIPKIVKFRISSHFIFRSIAKLDKIWYFDHFGGAGTPAPTGVKFHTQITIVATFGQNWPFLAKIGQFCPKVATLVIFVWNLASVGAGVPAPPKWSKISNFIEFCYATKNKMRRYWRFGPAPGLPPVVVGGGQECQKMKKNKCRKNKFAKWMHIVVC